MKISLLLKFSVFLHEYWPKLNTPNFMGQRGL